MDSFYRQPPFWQAYVRQLCLIKKRYPFLRLTAVGRSVQGRKLYALCLGKTVRPVLYAGAFHAQEWLTQSLLLYFCETLCRAVVEKRPIAESLAKRGVMILPCVNPDGVQLVLTEGLSAGRRRESVLQLCDGDFSEWNANIRGVDLNHNFDAGHDRLRLLEKAAGIDGPAPRRYGGRRPGSEPETRALMQLCRQCLFSRVYAFHSQGEEIYYRYGEKTAPESRHIAQMLAQSSGYALQTQEGLASHGGFKDFFLEKFERPGFTIEIGRGKNPLPIWELSPIFARLYEMLLLGVLL